MSKFKQLLAVVFIFALGLGIGQNLSTISWATDWPQGGAGSDHTISSTNILTNKTIDLDANTVTGTVAEFNTALQSSTFLTNTNGGQGINNIDDVNEEIQRSSTPDTTTSTDDTFGTGTVAVTFGEAFSANPIVLTGGVESTGRIVTGGRSVTTTGFSLEVAGGTSETITNISWLALGD